MPQDITINGAQYPDVPAVQIPKTGGGTAQFDDTTDATATAAEIASGKSAYVNNTRLVGTGQMVEPPLYVDTDLNSVGVGASPQITNAAEIAQDWRLVAKGKYNNFNYLPYSWVTSGSSTMGWLRIATINIADTQFDAPIEFLVQRRNDARSVKLSVLFNSQNTADPTLSGFYYDDISGTRSSNPFQTFIYKTGTSTWDVYVYMSGTYASISVYTLMPYYAQRWGSVTYAYGFRSDVPSGATMATPVPAYTPSTQPTFTKTSGNSAITSVYFVRSGNVCQMSFIVAATADIAEGNLAWSGTFNGSPPVTRSMGCGYANGCALICYLASDSSFNIRVTASTFKANWLSAVSLTYITNS